MTSATEKLNKKERSILEFLNDNPDCKIAIRAIGYHPGSTEVYHTKEDRLFFPWDEGVEYTKGFSGVVIGDLVDKGKLKFSNPVKMGYNSWYILAELI